MRTTPSPSLARQVLRQLLLDALEPGTVRWGHSFLDLGPMRRERAEVGSPSGSSPGCVHVRFAAPKRSEAAGAPPVVVPPVVVRVTASLVVGCDGIWSAVRRQKVATDAPRYLGVMVVLGRASVPGTAPGSELCDCSPSRYPRWDLDLMPIRWFQ